MTNNYGPSKDEADLGTRLGRAAGRLVKQARPHAKRIASDAKPLVEKATQYAVEHQEELKTAGAKLVRSRIAGPWGVAFDAVANAANRPANKDAATAPVCGDCGAENPKGAKFCNQCASPINNR